METNYILIRKMLRILFSIVIFIYRLGRIERIFFMFYHHRFLLEILIVS